MSKNKSSMRDRWNSRDMSSTYVDRRRKLAAGTAVVAAIIGGSAAGLIMGPNEAEGSEQKGITCDVQVGDGNSQGLITENQIANAIGAEQAMSQTDAQGNKLEGLDRGYTDDGSRKVFEGDHFIAENIDAAACKKIGATVVGDGSGSGPQS